MMGNVIVGMVMIHKPTPMLLRNTKLEKRQGKNT
uniref:SMP1 n=1 Tax=Arundo donax TaxID=35708 RepID=A0A0A9BMH8_ARUDO